jgi:hypothetical protein
MIIPSVMNNDLNIVFILISADSEMRCLPCVSSASQLA